MPARITTRAGRAVVNARSATHVSHMMCVQLSCAYRWIFLVIYATCRCASQCGHIIIQLFAYLTFLAKLAGATRLNRAL